MKQYFMFVCTFLWAIMTMSAQNTVLKPYQLVADSKKELNMLPVDIFTLSSTRNNIQIPKEISTYSILSLDKDALKKLNAQKAPLISFRVPQDGRNDLTLELVEVFPFAPGFSVKTAPSMETIKVNTGRHYRGIIKGQDRSVAAISFFDDQVMGFVSHPSATGNLVLGQIEGEQEHILYQDDQIAAHNSFDCKSKDNEFEYTKDELRGISTGTRALTDCVRLYLEVNYDIYLNKGSSTANVTTFVTGIFNQVSTLYTSEQINTVISEIVIWTQASPYNSTSSTGMLNAFTANRQGFNGNLAQLLSYQASGGVAYVDGLCRTNPDFSMSYAGIQSTYQNVPTYSWTVEVCAHEFGHLFGSQHTHACVWNGNNTAIDGCYTPEGSCTTPPLPQGGGTIMSYCHLTSAGINFANGFGPQPGNIMRTKVTQANCLQACSGGGSGGGGGGSGNPCNSNSLTLEVRTDNYPAETTWDIKNSAGAVLFAGGPYAVPNTLNTISLCLPTACYTFTIYDSYGDGICCSYGMGYYNIKQGNTTLITGGQFTNMQTRSFCATGTASSSCTDGIQNGQETGVDCGGPTCPACPTCGDGIQNGQETGVDCGGSCPPCNTSSCNDNIQNGQETGVDCGGPTCPVCPTSGNVQVTSIAGHYFETSMDGWADGGSDCARVNTPTNSPEGIFSIQIRDNSGTPSAMTSPVYNLIQYDSVTVEFKFKAVGYETAEDFWLRYFNGTVWSTVRSYVLPTDFANNIIYSRKVKINSPLSANAQFRFQADASDDTDQIHIDAVIIKGYKTISTGPTCSDGIQNGNETGTDCGGPCPACISCYDGIQNGNETGIDCGGPCPACISCYDGIQNGTETGVDCGGTCLPCITCNDGIQNGNETGVDCGGTCLPCITCTDGTQNGTETGVDCGGTCPPCPTGGPTTLAGHYFEIDWDGWLDGGSDCARYQGSQSPEGQFSIRIRDNSIEQSAMTSPVFNLSTFNTVNVQFKFRGEGMENGEDFWVRYYNGTTWNTIATLVAGTDFVNNQIYTVNITISGPLSNSGRFRFQCDASENDDNIYIDAIVITGTTGSSIFENSISIQTAEANNTVIFTPEVGIILFPNPVDDVVKIKSAEAIIKVTVYNMSGQLLLSKGVGFDSIIDMSGLNSGMYIFKIETEDNVYTERVVKK